MITLWMCCHLSSTGSSCFLHSGWPQLSRVKHTALTEPDIHYYYISALPYLPTKFGIGRLQAHMIWDTIYMKPYSVILLFLAVVWCWQDWMPSWDPLGVGRQRKDLGCWNFCLSVVEPVTQYSVRTCVTKSVTAMAFIYTTVNKKWQNFIAVLIADY